MCPMHTYSPRDALRETPGDRQAYLTSCSMQRIAWSPNITV